LENLMTDSQTEQPKKAPSLQPHRFALAESKRLDYVMDVPAGVPLSRVMEPDFFAHITALLRPWYRIEVRAEDGSYFAELLVRKVTREAAHCWLLRHVDLSAQLGKVSLPTAADFKIEFGGGDKWRVVRLSDMEKMHKGEPTREDAQAWLDQHLGTVVTV
jgi:hypothetical protein